METRVGSRRKRGPIIRRFRTVDYGLTRVEILASQARKSTLENRTRSECTREPPPTVDPVPLLVSESFILLKIRLLRIIQFSNSLLIL